MFLQAPLLHGLVFLASAHRVSGPLRRGTRARPWVADLVEVVTQSNGSKLPREPLYFSKMVLPGIEEASAYLR
jgi:hypothetical protein